MLNWSFLGQEWCHFAFFRHILSCISGTKADLMMVQSATRLQLHQRRRIECLMERGGTIFSEMSIIFMKNVVFEHISANIGDSIGEEAVSDSSFDADSLCSVALCLILSRT